MIEFLESIIFMVCTFILFYKYSKLYDEVINLQSIVRQYNFWQQIAKTYMDNDKYEKIIGELENEDY